MEKVTNKRVEFIVQNRKDTNSYQKDLPIENSKEINNLVFPSGFKLLPNVTEIFELQLAFYEYKTLTKDDLIKRSAYFQSIDGSETLHFQLCKETCEAIWQNRSNATANYFRNGLFSTGYATHGLFPYRGKFHPQLVKSLINLIGIEEGETILDPMCGSGTLNVEAALMNINSIGVDKNPFGCFMSKVKLDSLSIDSKQLQELTKNKELIIKQFIKNKNISNELLESNNMQAKIKRLFLLAFLDAMGYSRRTQKPIEILYPVVLDRYIKQVLHFLATSQKLKLKIGKSNIEFGDARNLSFIRDSSIDGIITSPPYSFAIDYAENDRPQLEYLGYNVEALRHEMIGLRGKSLKEKLEGYFDDMNKVLMEMARVLKENKYAIIIIGSNDIQTKGVRLESRIKEIAPIHKLTLVREIRKPIKGLRNTMQDEFILIFKKVE
jgi:DNA modification methylase